MLDVAGFGICGSSIFLCAWSLDVVELNDVGLGLLEELYCIEFDGSMGAQKSLFGAGL